MEDVDVPRELASLDCIGGPFDMITASFFLGRQKLLASPDKPGMALWRERLFAWMSRSSESAMEFFKIPTNRVVERGSQMQRSEERRLGEEGVSRGRDGWSAIN